MERIVILDCVDSTNDHAKKLAAAGAAHGTAVLARRQTAGRGRMGRSFLSPEGGLYLSVVLRPKAKTSELLHLTAVLASAACDAVEAVCGIRPGVKWINDLIWDGKKLAGVLTELSLRPDGEVDYAVAGIGINCNAPESAFSPEVREMAVSLHHITGTQICVETLADALVKHLTQACDCAVTERTAWMEKYRRDCVTLGKTVRVMGEPAYAAKALDVDENGALLVEDEKGAQHRIISGEVSVRGLYGYI